MDTVIGRRRRLHEDDPEEELEATVPWRMGTWATIHSWVEGGHLAFSAFQGTWVTIDVAFSAFLYLFDFVSTLITLKTYYYYDYRCPHHLLTDPVCVRLATNNNYASAFIICLVLMGVAHLSSVFIFYTSLKPEERPRRSAFFLPLIHLFNLLRLFWRSFSCKSLKDLYSTQEEATNLYNVLGASLDTIPQLILQYNIAISLLNYSASPEGPIPIPKILLISMIASLLSATYSGCTAILRLFSKCTTVNKVYIAITAGVYTLAVAVTKTTMVAALTVPYYGGVWLGLYAFVSMIIPWIFYLVLLQKQPNDIRKNIWSNIAQSLAFAHVSIFIGPMYVIAKYFKRSTHLLILATLLQIMVEILGIVEMVLIGRNLGISGTPCCPEAERSNNDNKFLTCDSVMGTLSATLFSIMLTSLIFVIIHQQETILALRVKYEIPSSEAL